MLKFSLKLANSLAGSKTSAPRNFDLTKALENAAISQKRKHIFVFQ